MFTPFVCTGENGMKERLKVEHLSVSFLRMRGKYRRSAMSAFP